MTRKRFCGVTRPYFTQNTTIKAENVFLIYYMEYWLDWVLYYRTEQNLRDLLKNVSTAKTKILFEDNGSQMFLHAKNSGI